jgi:hypothetical protein
MRLKAMLICDDVRVEVGGTLSLIGVCNERLIVDRGLAGEDEIELPRLVFFAVISDLTGVEQIGFRQRIRRIEDSDPDPLPLGFEPHDPAADEHNFVLSQTPMMFPGAGGYEVILDVDARGETVTYRYRFQLLRRT